MVLHFYIFTFFLQANRSVAHARGGAQCGEGG